MKIVQLAAAVSLAFSAVSASAVTVWGVHDPVEFGFGSAVGAATPLLDRYSFTLTSASSLMATAVSNDGPGLLLSDAIVALYQGPVGSGVNIGQFSFNNTSTSHAFLSLAAGSYYYVVNAMVGTDAVAGSYALTSQVSAVPEPETYGLMLAGLAMGGFIVLRRRGA